MLKIHITLSPVISDAPNDLRLPSTICGCHHRFESVALNSIICNRFLCLIQLCRQDIFYNSVATFAFFINSVVATSLSLLLQLRQPKLPLISLPQTRFLLRLWKLQKLILIWLQQRRLSF